MAIQGIAGQEDIDRMMRLDANFPMCPFEWADQIGLVRVLASLEALTRELGPNINNSGIINLKG